MSDEKILGMAEWRARLGRPEPARPAAPGALLATIGGDVLNLDDARADRARRIRATRGADNPVLTAIETFLTTVEGLHRKDHALADYDRRLLNGFLGLADVVFALAGELVQERMLDGKTFAETLRWRAFGAEKRDEKDRAAVLLEAALLVEKRTLSDRSESVSKG